MGKKKRVSEIISHISLGTNHFDRAVEFYEKVLAPLGIKKVMEFEDAVAFGKSSAEFWIQEPIDGKKAASGNGTHVAFIAPDKKSVKEFHKIALKLGAKDEGKPGPRPDYGKGHYIAFVRDLDGHKIEATYYDSSLAE